MICPTLCRADIISHTFSFENENVKCDTIVSPDENKYIRLSIDGASFCGNYGNPSIPMKFVNFEVPQLSNDFYISTSVDKWGEPFLLKFPLYPIQRDQIINEYDSQFFDNPNDTIYRMESFWCESIIFNEYFRADNKHIVTIAVPMAAYCGKNNAIRLCNQISINLHYSVTPNSARKSNRFDFIKSRLDETLSSIYEDYITLDGEVDCKDIRYSTQSDFKELTPNPYVILIPEYLKTYINTFASWKMQKGCDVIVKSYEDIWSSPEFKIGVNNKIFDKESSVREWLIDKKKKTGTFNLLLVGNSLSGAPIRKFFEPEKNYPNPESGNFNSPAYIPTDRYFSDLTTAYPIQLQPNGHYSCNINNVRGYSPSIPVGRLLLDQKNELDNYTKKNIIYQANPGLGDMSYLNTALVTRQLQHIKYTSLFSAIPQIKDSIIYKDNNAGKFEANHPTGEEVIMAMSKCGLMSIQGHGGPTKIACSGKNGDSQNWRYIQSEENLSFDHFTDEIKNGINNMQNFNKPSVLYSLSCTVVPYEIMEYHDGDVEVSKYNMGSAYSVMGEYGGVAFIGNTRTGWDYANKAMEYKCGQLLSQYAPLGIAVMNSANACTSTYAKYVRNLVGDPELTAWLYEPFINSLSVDVLNNGVKITGKNLSGCSICFYDGSGKSKSFAVADKDCITIPYSVLDSETDDFKSDLFSISIFKDQMMPYIVLASRNSFESGHSKQFVVNSPDFFKLKAGNDYFIVKDGLLKLTCADGVAS